MNHTPWLLVASFSLLLGSADAASQEDDSSVVRSLGECRAIADPSRRLACYDAIGRPPADGREPATETAPPASAATGDRAPEPSALPGDFGMAEDDEPDETSYTITISRCGEATNRHFYFYFDNGQVWRYVGRKKLRLRDCSGEATVVEDRIGIGIRLPGEDWLHRVIRVK
jgi:hypothetical protein